MEHPRVRAWFDAAAEASPEERARILEEARRTDPAEAEELESLLMHLEKSGGVFDRTPAEMAGMLDDDADTANGARPEKVGPFRILREIGRGGMGVVYEAEQEFPRRRVALKVIRPELIRTSLLRRFARETGALALLQHPSIAQLYEAGFADTSRRRPYIAMELVEGVPVSTFVKASKPSTKDILILMASVCDAVDHAHRRGVIHRDLKPGNILVTRDAIPKVLDFGVARLTGADEPEHTATAAGHFIGTIGYMSPEQLYGDPRQIDHRSDVYALGVILYELLAGRPPLDLAGLAVTQAAVAVRDREPTLLGRINHALRGDIEAIAGKALEKDPHTRYASASELASDIRRYLGDEPVQARAQTTWYQARKFARRNRALVTGVGATMLALLAGAGATTWQAIKATNERNTAAEQSLRAQETAALLTRMVKSAIPEHARGTDPTVRQMLDTAAADLAADTTVHPIVAGDTHHILAESFGSLGDYAKAKQHARLAADIRAKAIGATHPDTHNSVSYLARVLTIEENFKDALEIAKPNWEAALAAHGPDAYPTIRAAFVYGQVLVESDTPDFDKGIPLISQVYEHFRRTKGDDDIFTLSAGQGLGVALTRAGREIETVALLRRVLDGRERKLGKDHPDTLQSMDNLIVAMRNEPLDKLVVMQFDLVDRATRVMGASHSRTLHFRHNLCLMLWQLKRFDEAATEARRGHEHALARVGASHPVTLDFSGLLASILTITGKLDEADSMIKNQIDVCLKAYGPTHDMTYRSRTLVYDLEEARGNLAGMRTAAEALKGSPYAAECFRQLEIAEANAKAEAAKQDK